MGLELLHFRPDLSDRKVVMLGRLTEIFPQVCFDVPSRKEGRLIQAFGQGFKVRVGFNSRRQGFGEGISKMMPVCQHARQLPNKIWRSLRLPAFFTGLASNILKGWRGA